MRNVSFEDPFCYLEDGKQLYAIRSQIRRLIAYYFLAAGFVTNVGGYHAYPREFKMACD